MISTMQVQALTKFVRISPFKAREITKEIQGLNANSAMDLLSFIPRKSARLVRKTLQSAIANAENNHNLSADDLIIEKALVEQGPTIKRFNPVSKGSAHPIKKRTSHFRVILSKQETPTEN